MDDELLQALQVVSEYCRDHIGCEGCEFYSRIRFLKKAEGHCSLTDRVPEDWDELYS